MLGVRRFIMVILFFEFRISFRKVFVTGFAIAIGQAVAAEVMVAFVACIEAIPAMGCRALLTTLQTRTAE